MPEVIKHKCVYRELSEDGKTKVDKEGRCICTLDIRKRCPRTQPCVFCKEDAPHTPAEMIAIMKTNPMEVVEDVFLDRKLSGHEKLIAGKFVKKYYTIPKN